MNITPAPARTAGGLAGYVWVCPSCSMEISNTIEVNCETDALQHEAWHERSGR